MQETLALDPKADPTHPDFNPFEDDSPRPERKKQQTDPQDNWRKKSGKKHAPGTGKYLMKPAFRVLEARYPNSFFWPAEVAVKRWTGGGIEVHTKDMLGFMDIIGSVAPNGHLVGVQVTNAAGVKPHLIKYTSASETHGTGGVPIGTFLRRFLRTGGTFLLLGFEKVGRQYEPVVELNVTEAVLDECCARARGRKTA